MANPVIGDHSRRSVKDRFGQVRSIIVPGWRGPGHWQSLWAGQLGNAVRVQQNDGIKPSR